MDRDDYLLEQLYATAQLMNTPLEAPAALMILSDLAAYPPNEIAQALSRCRAEVTGRLTLAAILERLPKRNSHLGGNEAWALALASTDEAETVVWTEEISRAFAAASPIMAEGDKVGARMAFLEAYDRAVTEAKAQGRAPNWFPSLGHDPERRRLALEDAVRAGQLPAPDAAALLPPPEPRERTEAQRQQAQAITAELRRLISGQEVAANDHRQRLEQEQAERRAELDRQEQQLSRGAYG